MKRASRVITSILVPAAIVLATFSTTQPAVADDEMSLKDKQAWAEIVKHMDEKAAAATEKCGTTITAKLDIASFKGQDIFKQSPTAQCREAEGRDDLVQTQRRGHEGVTRRHEAHRALRPREERDREQERRHLVEERDRRGALERQGMSTAYTPPVGPGRVNTSFVPEIT